MDELLEVCFYVVLLDQDLVMIGLEVLGDGSCLVEFVQMGVVAEIYCERVYGVIHQTCHQCHVG